MADIMRELAEVCAYYGMDFISPAEVCATEKNRCYQKKSEDHTYAYQ